MPIINAVLVESTPTLDHSPSGRGSTSASPGAPQPNLLLGASIGCASLAAVLAGIFVWTCLKRRKKKAREIKIPVPALVNPFQESKPRNALDLDLEKCAPLDVPDIIITPPFEDLTLEAIDVSSDSNSVYSSETDSRDCPDTPVQDDDDFDFKCRGLDYGGNDPGTGSCDVQFNLFSESIYETKCFYWSTSASLTPEDNGTEDLSERLGMASLMAITEEDEDEGEGSSDIVIPVELLGKNTRLTLESIEEEAEGDSQQILASVDHVVGKEKVDITEVEVAAVSEVDVHLVQDKQVTSLLFFAITHTQLNSLLRILTKHAWMMTGV